MKYELWAMRDCIACYFTKEVFEERKLNFAEKFLYEDFTMRDLKEKTGRNEMPAIFIDGVYVGGVDWVSDFINKEKK